ncbi:hypothetical protein ACLF3G_23145 [Falsiroseomonas sp. HC035]
MLSVSFDMVAVAAMLASIVVAGNLIEVDRSNSFTARPIPAARWR